VTKSGPHIAVVDDEASVRTALGRLLRLADYQVTAFASGEDFLASLATRLPDCAILDVHMPGLSGFDVQTLNVRDLLTGTLPIEDHDTTASLHDKVAALGADLMVQALELAGSGRLQPQKQPAEGVTYAHKIEKHEAAIDWRQDAQAIVRRVRAFNPFPVATTTLDGEVLKVWGAHVGEPGGSADCGQIMAVTPEGIAVAAMNSIVNLVELQRPGGKRLPVAEFIRGVAWQPGMRMDVGGDAA